MPAFSHYRKSGKSCAKLIFAENYVQNFAFKKNSQFGNLWQFGPPDLQFSDIKISICQKFVLLHFYCNKKAIIAILRNQALAFLHALGIFCHFND